MKTIIVWFRNDLRVHDHLALSAAVHDADVIVPLFIIDDELFERSPNRSRFLLQSLADLRSNLKSIGGELYVRHGEAKTILQKIINETSADAVYYTQDYTPYAVSRDKALRQTISVPLTPYPGRLIVDDFQNITTKAKTAHKVFTPFYKNWQTIQRRDLAKTPTSMQTPRTLDTGSLPAVKDLPKEHLSPDAIEGGESAAIHRFKEFAANDINLYHDKNNDMAAASTSRLSAYLHFGCISPLAIEHKLPDNQGARAWHRQLAWREFYHYILHHNPSNTRMSFQQKYRALSWDTNPKALNAWQTGQTGYPLVDAAMRQLQQEGYMHNRARLVVASFLTKDLWLNWQDGEAHFMHMLLDGDTANNNGNWQWIASVGVDPAPVYRRLYNPSTQLERYDPTGAYTRRYVPELKNVPDKYLAEPWKMPSEMQKQVGCTIGKDYPNPIVDHKQARSAALEKFRSVTN